MQKHQFNIQLRETVCKLYIFRKSTKLTESDWFIIGNAEEAHGLTYLVLILPLTYLRSICIRICLFVVLRLSYLIEFSLRVYIFHMIIVIIRGLLLQQRYYWNKLYKFSRALQVFNYFSFIIFKYFLNITAKNY